MKPQTRRRVPRSGSSPLAAKCLRVSSAHPTSQQHRREQRAAGEGASTRLSWRNVPGDVRARVKTRTETPPAHLGDRSLVHRVPGVPLFRRPVAFSLLALAMKASGPMEGVPLQAI